MFSQRLCCYWIWRVYKNENRRYKKTINDGGLTCPSCHFGSAEFGDDKIDESIQFAHDLGLTQMICSTFWLPKTATLNDYLVAADKLNKAAEKIKTSGMQAGFHNHEFEFATFGWPVDLQCFNEPV